MTAGVLQDLLAVQDLDLSADQLRHRRATLAQRAELAGLDAEEAASRTSLAEVDRQRDDLGARQNAAETELASTEQRAAAVSRRLFSGEVSASRELQAMSAELEQLKGRASVLEDTVLEVMEEREPLDARAGELAGRLAELGGRRADVTETLRTAEKDIDAELEEVAARRAAVASKLPAALLSTYDRLRSRLGGIGVARLVGNRCDGCHLTLPAMELDRVRHLAEGEVYQCEQCSRILVP